VNIGKRTKNSEQDGECTAKVLSHPQLVLLLLGVGLLWGLLHQHLTKHPRTRTLLH
jgi:hypothetical protein